jgi:hypothetical protein
VKFGLSAFWDGEVVVKQPVEVALVGLLCRRGPWMTAELARGFFRVAELDFLDNAFEVRRRVARLILLVADRSCPSSCVLDCPSGC